MKKTLEQELKLIAEKILSNNETDLGELKKLTRKAYENLCILSYLEELKVDKTENKGNFGHKTKVSPNWIDEEKSSSETEEEDRYAPDGTHYNPEAITEPNTEKIKDIVEQMPPDNPDVLGKIFHSDDFENELRKLGVHYDDLPQFEPVEKSTSKKSEDGSHSEEKTENTAAPNKKSLQNLSESKISTGNSETKKSLNDRLKKGISFGLNDRLVFIKHLFGGNSSDYDRVLSQLNTFQSFESARSFLETVV
ncbi:MAG TPA: hypothetical protein VFM82_02450, partial [Flavobacteriaceae bacterium]|nr:hypothetical protein [Flavobacteriaceae bacterium]